MIALGGAQCLVRGAVTVLAVVLAVEVTDLGRPGVGILWAAFGVGGFVAALASIGAAGSARLGTLFGAGIALWGVPIALIAVLTGSPVAVGAFVVIGAANALVDVTGFTLLQRLVPDQTLACVLALTEADFSLALALGSLAGAFVLAGLGETGALVATGCVLPLAVALRWAALRAIDADIGVRKTGSCCCAGSACSACCPSASSRAWHRVRAGPGSRRRPTCSGRATRATRSTSSTPVAWR